MRLRVVWSVAWTSFRDFMRTPDAVFWTYGFPIVMAIGLGIAFSGGGVEPVRVAVAAESGHAQALKLVLERGSQARIVVDVVSADEAARDLRTGAIDLVLSGSRDAPDVDVDMTRPTAELAMFWVERALALDAGRDVAPIATIRPVTDLGSRYIDFLIPGLIGINLLGAGLYGIGFNMVNMRVRNLLRRLYVTPMRPAEFLSGYVVSRLLLTVPEAFFVVLFGVLAFDVPVIGSLMTLALIVVAGGFAFAGLGLLVSSRAKTTEAVSGLINLVTLPMWILGGSFFSNERFPEVVQPLVQIMPLTHVNDALRAVMLGGAGLTDTAVWVPLLVLSSFALICTTVAVRIFRWS